MKNRKKTVESLNVSMGVNDNSIYLLLQENTSIHTEGHLYRTKIVQSSRKGLKSRLCSVQKKDSSLTEYMGRVLCLGERKSQCK